MRVWITKSVQQATIGGRRADIVPASNYSSGGLVWHAFNVGLRMDVIRGRLFGLLTPVSWFAKVSRIFFVFLTHHTKIEHTQ